MLKEFFNGQRKKLQDQMNIFWANERQTYYDMFPVEKKSVEPVVVSEDSEKVVFVRPNE